MQPIMTLILWGFLSIRCGSSLPWSSPTVVGKQLVTSLSLPPTADIMINIYNYCELGPRLFSKIHPKKIIRINSKTSYHYLHIYYANSEFGTKRQRDRKEETNSDEDKAPCLIYITYIQNPMKDFLAASVIDSNPNMDVFVFVIYFNFFTLFWKFSMHLYI